MGQAVVLQIQPGGGMPGHHKNSGGSESLTLLLCKWFKLCGLWFTGTEKWKARAYALTVVVLSLVNTLFMVRISYAQRNFSTALSGKDVAGFYHAVWEFVVIICIAAPLFSFNTFLEDRLVLTWRAYLTRTLLDAYFDNRSYFYLRQQSGALGACPGNASLDNPDQRICDDVGAFCRSSTSISLSLVKKIFNCAAFASVLWSVSPTLVAFLFGYAIVGTAATTSVFGKVLTTLYYKLLACEGDMRFSLVRVREHAESIAFYRGDGQERQVVGGRFEQVLRVTFQRIKWTALYDLWTSIYNYATILVPSLLTAPRYFRGEIEFGVISQAGFAFSSIESALSVIINNLAQLSGLAAETDRLDALRQAMMATSQWSSMSKGISRLQQQQSGLQLDQLCVQLPGSQQVIWRDLSLVLNPGESLLVVGPSGCGKSSLLRALAGLWSEGCGTALLPPASSTFFLPQKPFMPLGSLRQQLMFPSGSVSEASSTAGSAKQSGPASTSRSGSSSSNRHAGPAPDDGSDATELAPLLRQHEYAAGLKDVTGQPKGSPGAQSAWASSPPDAALERLLEEVCLPGLLEAVGGFDAEMDWSHVLSGGEQQRVAFLRLLLQQPQLAFLDEATSAVDAATEAKLYQQLADKVPCYVSVGHRQQLVKFHTHVLEHTGLEAGAWALHTAEQYQLKLASGPMPQG